MLSNGSVNRFKSSTTLGALVLIGLFFTLFASASCSSDSSDGDAKGGASGAGAPSVTAGNAPVGGGAGANSCASCGAGQTCQNGVCVCLSGLRLCGGACISQFSDPKHCGGCNMACAGTSPFCNLGMCSAACSTGLRACNGGCVNDQTDPFNCGNCGNACRTGQNCSAGTCVGGQGTGGTGAGGASNTGGSSTGGSAGLVGTGGGSGGSSGGGGGTAPPGYWTSGSWHGCAWTAIDALASSTTTNTPRDFLTHTPGMPHCVAGTVHPSYEAVALLGFNLTEPTTANCAYKPSDPTKVGSPGIQLSGGTGIALNFNKKTASTLRIQIEGPKAASDANDRWCFPITEVAGPIFAPFNKFNTKCWDGTGTAYAGQPISAVVFLVPGAPNPTQFGYCINGFAVGNSAADAPKGGDSGGPLTGTIGGAGVRDLDFQRVKVQKGGKDYIIQNNNWGNPEGSDQTITYSDNSFTVVSSTGSTTGQGVPASFPSIFIGANGDTQNGVYTTRTTDGLPKQISQIQKLMTTFRYSGGKGGGDYNAAYDVWFAASPPTAPYNDAISGFVMLWLYKPGNHQPIGSRVENASFTGAGHTWEVWRGPRGGSGSNSGAPVVSYVSSASGLSNFDLKPFIVDAAKHGIQSSWHLTDVFAGFEIWSGGDATGLKVDEFTAVVE